MAESPTGEVVYAPDPAAFDTTLTAIRSGNFQVTCGDQGVDVHGRLGSGGGTKTVYDASIHDESFALALPNTVDDARTALDKWRVALHEPEATDKMREMGFIVNPVCEVMAVNVNDVPLPAIKMSHYQDVPIQIRDGKNHSSSIIESDLLAGDLDMRSFMDETAGIRADIATLIRNGVGIGRDSFNVCVVDGQMRLYFNDLAKARFEPIDHEETRDYADFYSKLAIGAIMNGMGHDEFQRHQKFFDEYFGFRGEGYDGFSSLPMAELTPAV